METIFVNAENGGILINEGPGNPGEFAKTPATVAQLIKKFDIINRGAAFCSSMDFADEYGFKTSDGALKLWNEAIDIVNFEVNGVA